MATWKGYKRKCVNKDGSVFYYTKWEYEETRTMNKYELQFPNSYRRETSLDVVQDDFSTRFSPAVTQTHQTVKSVLTRKDYRELK